MDILQGLSQNQLGSLRVRQFPAGSLVFREGDDAYGLYSVLQGKVEICRGLGTDSKRLALMERGDIFGEMALILHSGKRGATARAVETAVLFEIPGNPIELARALPDQGVAAKLLENLIVLLSVRLREANKAIASVDDEDDGMSDVRTLSGEETDFRGPLAVIARALPREAWLHKRIPAGAELCREGDESDGFYFLHEGKVEVVHAENGREHIMAKLRGPLMVGEVGCFAGERRSATVRAATPVEYTYFPRAYFEQLRQSDPKEAAEILLAVARVIVHFITKPRDGAPRPRPV
jgi:CRP-like cAMP-binding protein